MDYVTIWNEICFHVKKNRDSTERDFQTTVEFIFEKLGWSQYKGEIVTQLNIPVGSAGNVRPDLVIKENDNIVLVIELIRAGADLSERNGEQLISYMRLLRLNYGILLGETLQIFSEIQQKSNMPIKICDISFKENSEVGIECIEVLSKNDFSFDRLNEFAKKCIEQPEMYCEDKKLRFSVSLTTKNQQKSKRTDESPDLSDWDDIAVWCKEWQEKDLISSKPPNPYIKGKYVAFRTKTLDELFPVTKPDVHGWTCCYFFEKGAYKMHTARSHIQFKSDRFDEDTWKKYNIVNKKFKTNYRDDWTFHRLESWELYLANPDGLKAELERILLKVIPPFEIKLVKYLLEA